MSRFHVLRSWTHFRRYRGRRVTISYFALPNSFSAISCASGPFFIFCAPGLIFGGTEGVGSCFQVLRSRSRFRRFQERRVQFSCFSLPNSFSVEPWALGPIFIFCTLVLIFIGTEGLETRIHVFCSQTSFRRNPRRRVELSCFPLPDEFSAIEGASSPVFMFCAPEHVFAGTESLVSCIHVFRSWTHFRRYRGRWVPLSCFALPDSFSA
jgi:hypothetical protein